MQKFIRSDSEYRPNLTETISNLMNEQNQTLEFNFLIKTKPLVYRLPDAYELYTLIIN